MGKTKDVRGAVEAELRFDPRIDTANIAPAMHLHRPFTGRLS